MARSLGWFLAFVALNVLALYLPGLVWVPFAPGPANFGVKWLVSPVILPVLILNPRSILVWVAVFTPFGITVPGFALPAFSRYPWLAFIGPFLLFGFSFGQGLIFLLLMHLDFLGEC